MTSAAPFSVVLTLFSKGKEEKKGAAEVIFERVAKIIPKDSPFGWSDVDDTVNLVTVP